MTARLSLTAKVFLIAALNVLLLAAAAVVVVVAGSGRDFDSFLLTTARERSLAVGRAFALELNETDPEGRNRLAARYESTYGVRVLLFANDGTQLAGERRALPGAVRQEVVAHGDEGPGGRGRGRGRGRGPGRGEPPPFPPPDGREGPPPEFDGVPPMPDSPPFLVETDGPEKYWIGVRIPVRQRGSGATIPGTLLFASASLMGNPFYFQPMPWLAVVGATLLLTALCWLPFVRGLTRAIGEMTQATGDIARGRFDIVVSSRRGDELGTLAEAIQRMSAQLKALVTGQKRFLGDAAHELRSPLARISVAIGLLERTSDPDTRRHVEDVREDVGVMTTLTDDLLAYARAELGTSTVRLATTRLDEAIDRAIRLEGRSAEILRSGDRDLQVVADPDLLCRALANLVRNAVQHAPGGAIRIETTRDADRIRLSVADEGPGVPEADLPSVFAPFHRPEPSRDRRTGGAGLGLAIVRSAIEACGGSVTCRNLTPRGFEVSLRLRAA